LIAVLAFVAPLVDELYDNLKRCTELKVELARAESTAKSLSAWEVRLAETTEQLTALETRAVSEATLAEYRSRVVDLVRTSGCQMRRIDIGPPVARPWQANDHAVRTDKAQGQEPTPFALERRSLTLVVDGTMPAIYDLLNKLDEEADLAYSRSLRMQPGNRQGKAVTLELELWLFNLTRDKA
jgi:hypothetical protein